MINDIISLLGYGRKYMSLGARFEVSWLHHLLSEFGEISACFLIHNLR